MTEKRKMYYALTADQVQTYGRSSLHGDKMRQAQIPSFSRDVFAVVVLFSGLVGLAALAGVELVVKVLERLAPELGFGFEEGWWVVPLTASIAGLGALIVRLDLWDRVWEIRPEPPIALPLEEIPEPLAPEAEVIAQVQTADGVIRYAKYNSFENWRRSDFQGLAKFLYAYRNQSITRDLLISSGLWKNLTGKGQFKTYRYQDVFGDLDWLKWVINGRVTQGGLDWAAETVPGLGAPHSQTVEIKI